LWGKSGKGSAAALADRIALAWVQKKSIETVNEISTSPERKVQEGIIDQKRKSEMERKGNTKKAKKAK
jgi:hypothetical protein